MADYLIAGRDYLARTPGFELIGRTEELNKLCTILVRQFSNSVIMVSPPGAGVTSLCMGLEAMKGTTDSPFDIASKSIFWLDCNELFATGDAAQIETAFRRAIERLSAIPQALLIIEDAGDFQDGCRNVGTLHFVNMINSAIQSKKLQVIFETSDEDVDKLLKWHSDMREFYSIMDVTEPSGADLEQIVLAAAKKLEAAHSVKIDEDAIIAAIELTEKYRAVDNSVYAQPRRAISLLDQAMASYRLAAHSMPPQAQALSLRMEAGTASDADRQLYEQLMQKHVAQQAQMRSFHSDQLLAEENLIRLEAEAKRIEEDGAVAGDVAEPRIVTRFTTLSGAANSGALDKIRTEISNWRRLIRDHHAAYAEIVGEINSSLHLDRQWVLAEFSKISKISVAKLGEDDIAILRRLEGQLKSAIFGQDHAVEKLANAIKVARFGQRNRHKPQAVFLFPGPSGVGKTELAKQVAKALYGDEKALLRLDMSEYMERHSVARLIGAPPGYDGFEAGGQLTNEIRKSRSRVILFDETEKAHPDVYNVLLQVIDDGRLTDNIGRIAEFNETIIILTTNIGQPHFLNDELTFDEQMAEVMKELGDHFRPEFLNRFNGRENIVGFKKLEVSTIERIIHREVNDLAAAYRGHGVEVKISEETISAFCKHRYQPHIGARGLPGFIISDLESRIVNSLLERSTPSDVVLDVGYDHESGRFTIESNPRAVSAA